MIYNHISPVILKRLISQEFHPVGCPMHVIFSRRQDLDCTKEKKGTQRREQELTGFDLRSVLDEEDLGEVVVIRRQSLLVELQLPQSFVLLVLERALMLDHVQLGFAGIVAQRAEEGTRVRAASALLF